MVIEAPNEKIQAYVEYINFRRASLENNSCVLNRTQKLVPTTKSEVFEYGDELGRGGFCSVHAIRNYYSNRLSIEEKEQEESNVPPENKLLNNTHSYAIKVLRPDLDDSLKLWSSFDMEKEAKFLSVLSHKNIVSVHFTSSFHNNMEGDYFLVLDKMDITLDRLILQWRRMKNVEKQRWKCHTAEASVRLSKQLTYRLKCCHEILSGLAYLHEKNIIYRDLKPENIGMDSQGSIKIFDFGLAKELKDTYKVRDDQYRLSITGTRRYMSPEVFLGELYGKPADIYSFALLMWQCVSLRLPYADLKDQKFIKKVMIQKKRPKLSGKLDSHLRTLIHASWSHNPALRPTAAALYDEIGVYVSRREFRDGDGSLIPSNGTSRFGSTNTCIYYMKQLLRDIKNEC